MENTTAVCGINQMKKNKAESGDAAELEHQIMDCWWVTKDLELIRKFIEPLETEELDALLVGLIVKYNMSFELLFDNYEKCMKDRKL